jgi:flagellar biosynthesis protein FlhA
MDSVQSEPIAGPIPFLTNNSDMILAGGVVCILIFMVMPLPTFLLDLLLVFNITISLVILLVAMYLQRPLELSSFPSILLLTTLFRLSLNIATTRVILLHGSEGAGAAGTVIRAFGAFVVGGNYLVGLIVSSTSSRRGVAAKRCPGRPSTTAPWTVPTSSCAAMRWPASSSR